VFSADINTNVKYFNYNFRFCVKNMQNFNEESVIKRIRLLRNQYSGGRGKSIFARALGISPSTYSYYEKDRIPPPEILLKICEITQTNLYWLLTGEKNFLDVENNVWGANAALLRKIGALLTKKPEMSASVSAFIDLLCEKTGFEEKIGVKTAPPKPISPEKTKPDVVAFKVSAPKPKIKSAGNKAGWIPVLGRTAAGIVHFWDQSLLADPQQTVTELEQLVSKHIDRPIVRSDDKAIVVDLKSKNLFGKLKSKDANLIQAGGDTDEQIVEFVECEDIFRKLPDSFALRIDGDSMSPRINDGDVVILSPSVPAVQGQIAVVQLANQIGVTCKLIRMTEEKVHLIPLNERYETKIAAKEDLLWALGVLCHISI